MKKYTGRSRAVRGFMMIAGFGLALVQVDAEVKPPRDGGPMMKLLALRLRNQNRAVITRCWTLGGALLLTHCLTVLMPGSGRAEEPNQPLPPSTAASSPTSSWQNPLSWKWTPTGEELQKYRRSWNPMANGPILNTGVDVQPQGQFLIQPFVFGEFGHQTYGNKLTTASSDSKDHIQAIAPTFIFAYGLTDNFEIDVIPAGASTLWWQDNKATSSGRDRSQAFGPGDTTIYLKNRLRVQDPETWQPTITQFHQVVLPSSQWFGTPGIPGGFSPLGRLPATKFGALSYTEGLMFRKNLRPFRVSAGAYYTYTVPGSTAGMNTYIGDIVNARLIFEHILDDDRGFGYNLEFVYLGALPFRADGHAINTYTVPNTHATTLNLFGVEPALQYKFFQDDHGALVAAAGVLFSVAGQNNINAVYPNLSIYYYWSKGKVMMR